MTVSRKIVEAVQKSDVCRRVQRAQVGVLYTAVQLDTGAVGVAYSFPRQGCGPSSSGGSGLAGRPAAEIVRFLGSKNLADSSCALAAVNAVASQAGVPAAASECDVLESIDVRDGDIVCMVGCFLPIMERLRNRRVTARAVDLEQKPCALPAKQAVSILPESQIALITATAVINGTIDSLLEAAGRCREVVILGPSTPLIPAAFTQTPVTCLAGIRVEHPDELFRIIGEGGGFRLFRPCTKKYTVRISQGKTASPHSST